MTTLTDKQAHAVLAFMECFDLYGSSWGAIESGMRDDFGVESPEDDLEDARAALSN